ncbi:hypothetical protein FRB97_006341 [Tulasnella sp. 331]|nr:hypothetical protein FRB97_006341 [Tulasnella sp. 331]
MSYGPPSGAPGGFGMPSFPSQGYTGQGQGGGMSRESNADDVGTYEGGASVTYRITHRDDNTILTLSLQPNYGVKSRSNSMICMSPTVNMQGQFKVSFKNLLSTDQLSQATYHGPGDVILSPQVWGDIVPIRMDGQRPWYLGHHAYLASTENITWTAKSQGFKKTLFSGDGMFVANVTGAGMLFVEAIGALVQKQLGPGEELIVDRGHLVAWDCQYKMEKQDMPVSDTIDWITSSECLPKSAAGWAVPAATMAALLAGITVVIKSIKGADKSPPMISSWVPWLGNTWQLDRDGYAFLKAAQDKYPAGIFGVTYAGQKLYFVTSPELINQVHKQHKMAWTKNIFSLSDKALFGSMVFPEKLAPHFDRSISPKNMMGLLESFDNHLQNIVTEMSLPDPNDSVSLTNFVIQITYKATALAMFGPTFDAEGTWEDFNSFDSLVWKVANGYPPSLLRGFADTRERVIKAYEKYLEAPHEPSELIGGQQQIARDGGFDLRDRGVIMLCDFWPVMANLPWGTLWTLIMQLKEPSGVKPLVDELDAAGAQFLDTSTGATVDRYYEYPLTFLQSSPSLPLLDSAFSETLRYATDSYSMRGVAPDEGTILGGYELKKGDTVICSTRNVHMDEKQFEHAEKWIPERFLNDTESGKGTEGNYKWMPFGGGTKICPGRHLAQYHVKTLITTLLKNFRFEIDHAKSRVPIKVGPVNRGFGFGRPDGDLFVKITRVT